jgi:alkanesulfonate monooxygenase SsuD/methylene tetrahydromethanopterin reductase-like flavin-dependent oxidoreductase (luciferase family)
VGGHSPAAYRRAVARGQGWYGYWLTPDDVATSLEGLRIAAEEVERPVERGALEISVTPRNRITAEHALAFAELGVDRLVVRVPPRSDRAVETIETAVTAVASL